MASALFNARGLTREETNEGQMVCRRPSTAGSAVSHFTIKSYSFDSQPSESEKEDVETDECHAVPLLKVYMPTARAAGGHFQVQMCRASLEQPFGVSFIASSASSGVCSVTVDEDAPHLGLRKSDRLVTINGVTPTSVKECASIMHSAFAVAMVLERQLRRSSVDSTRNSQRPDAGAKRRASLDGGPGPRLLLYSTRPQVLNARGGTFKLSLVRASLHQKFGLAFTAGSGATIALARNMPHLGLLAGDQLLVINNSRATDSGVCQRTLHNSRDITLEMRRHPSKLNRLVPEVESIEDDDWISDQHVSEHQYCPCATVACCKQVP